MRSRRLIVSILMLLVLSLVYNVYDNARFRVVEEEITIKRLPEAFDGFKILQISDLHGRYFGENQADLVRAINDLDYDMIAFTGDMNSSSAPDDSVESAQAILDVLDGIENKEHLFWVDGNVGPYAMESFQGAKTGELTAIGAVLQDQGCKILTQPYPLIRGNDRIWITPAMSEVIFWSTYRSCEEEWVGGKDNYDEIQSYYQEAYQSFRELNGNGEVKIMLDHYPQQLDLTKEELAAMGDLDYDLILAGHYHGGQWRLPLIGALYVPSPTAGTNSGYFPAQDEVKGLNYYGDVPQYISAGLGATGHSPFTSFRLFNTPEINLITLRCE